MSSPARPSRVAMMTPSAMKVANTAKLITTSRPKFLNDPRVPYSQMAMVLIGVFATTK